MIRMAEWLSKKRKLQLNASECQEHMKSTVGASALTNPSQSLQATSKPIDPNRGLYPRKKKKKRFQDGGNSSDEDKGSYSGSSSSLDFSLSKTTRNVRKTQSNLNTESTGPLFQLASGMYTENYSQGQTSYTDQKTNVLPNNFRQNSPKKQSPRKKKVPSQNNNLHNYFENVSKPIPNAGIKMETVVKNESSNLEKTSLPNSFNLDCFSPWNYSSSDSSHETVRPSLAVEISNSHRAMQKLVEISSSDDDEDFGQSLLGLTGSGGQCETETEENDCSGFHSLPDDALEMIFCHLPLQDLLLNMSLVCQRWHGIIGNNKFLPWRKLYYQAKINANVNNTSFSLISAQCKISGHTEFLFNIFILLKNFKPKPSEDMLTLLKNHPKYSWSLELLKLVRNKLEESPELEPNLWHVLVSLVLVSENVLDIKGIFKCLLQPKSQCILNDVLECFYLLATFFLYTSRKFEMGQSLHYRLFYTLYWFENQWIGTTQDIQAIKNSTGQQSIFKYGQGKIKLTHQQMRIVNHVLEQDQIVKIVAFAGTGKTTTLVHYTKLRLGKRFLLVVFNKAVCEHSSKTFPANTECRTAHSLAFKEVGKKYSRKLCPSLKPYDIQNLLERAPAHIAKRFTYSGLVLKSINHFIASSDLLITLMHVPEDYLDDEQRKVLTDRERLDILCDAELVWKKMIDPFDLEVKMLHDGYLKLYQLSKPKLEGYDAILIDEAQDCNPAMLDIFLTQSCPKILVGDPHQQIYAFRGAVNALQTLTFTHIYYLTESFRFGSEIAYVAHTVLEGLKKVKDKTLVGGNQESCISGKYQGQIAVLSRTNYSLFKEAVRLICTGPIRKGEPVDIRGSFIGGTDLLQPLIDIYILKKLSGGEPLPDGVRSFIKNRFIVRFKSYASLREYSKHSFDYELQGKINLVEAYGDLLPVYVNKITEKCRFNLSDANIVFSTVHKSKGLEYDTVMMTDDFNIGSYPLLDTPIINFGDNDNELNLLYVAITRAKHCLLLSKATYFVLLGANEKFEYPVPKIQLQEPNLCWNCGLNFEPDMPFVFRRKEITLGCGLHLHHGVCCSSCASKRIYVETQVEYPTPVTLQLPRVLFRNILRPLITSKMEPIVQPMEMNQNFEGLFEDEFDFVR